MRIAIAVLGLISLLSVPAHSAWLVKLKTGEVLTVESYWRDGDKTHLLRGGVDIIVANDRIESMEDGAPEPETSLQSATARGGGGGPAKAAPSAAPADAKPAETDGKRAETDRKYKERLAGMPLEDLRAEEKRVTKDLLDAQAARFQARYAGSKEEAEAVDKRFREAQRRDDAAEALLEERTAQQ